MSRFTPIARLLALGFGLVFLIAESQAQSTRPRRVSRQSQKSTATTTSKSASEPLLRPEPTASPTARRTNPNDSLLDVQPVKPVVNTVGTADRKSTRLNSSHGYISYAVF